MGYVYVEFSFFPLILSSYEWTELLKNDFSLKNATKWISGFSDVST